jgi:hypothetical protein
VLCICDRLSTIDRRSVTNGTTPRLGRWDPKMDQNISRYMKSRMKRKSSLILVDEVELFHVDGGPDYSSSLDHWRVVVYYRSYPNSG